MKVGGVRGLEVVGNIVGVDCRSVGAAGGKQAEEIGGNCRMDFVEGRCSWAAEGSYRWAAEGMWAVAEGMWVVGGRVGGRVGGMLAFGVGVMMAFAG